MAAHWRILLAHSMLHGSCQCTPEVVAQVAVMVVAKVVSLEVVTEVVLLAVQMAVKAVEVDRLVVHLHSSQDMIERAKKYGQACRPARSLDYM